MKKREILILLIMNILMVIHNDYIVLTATSNDCEYTTKNEMINNYLPLIPYETEPKYEPMTLPEVPTEPSTEPETEPEYIYTPVDMYYQTAAKTYMDYRAITNTDSPQWALIYSDEITVCDDGFLRDSEGYIGVAMGSYFGDIGSRYICYLENGKEIPVIKVEAKSDRHAIDGFCGYQNYDILEFVIDCSADWMQDNYYENGYIFGGNFDNCDMFSGTIISIDKVEKNT